MTLKKITKAVESAADKHFADPNNRQTRNRIANHINRITRSRVEICGQAPRSRSAPNAFTVMGIIYGDGKTYRFAISPKEDHNGFYALSRVRS